MCNSPMTSEFCVDEINQASSPNRPNLGLDRWKSLGNPHATDTKCGFTLLFGSTNVEKPFRNARATSRVVQQIDCIFSLLLAAFILLLFFLLLYYYYYYCECKVSRFCLCCFSIWFHSLDVQHLIRQICLFILLLFFVVVVLSTDTMLTTHNKMKYLMHSHGTSIDWLAGYGNDKWRLSLCFVLFYLFSFHW